MVIGTVAATLVVVLAIGLAIGGGTGTPVAGTSPSPEPTSTRQKPPFPTAAALLTDDAASVVNPKAQWAEQATQDGLDDSSPRPVCVSAARTEGETPPTKILLRVLTTPETTGASALHILSNYATADDATAAYDFRARQLGTCASDPTWVSGAYRVTGVGDEAVAITAVVQNEPTIHHTVMVVRTGTAVNIYDFAQPKQAANVNAVLQAAAVTTDRQCTGAVGLCSLGPSTAPTVPPAGPEPGVLTPGDIPRITPGQGSWTASGKPSNDYDFKGTLCEGVSSWRSPKGIADSRGVAYLLNDDPDAPALFGFDHMMLTFKDAASAKAFADQVQTSMSACTKKQLTASVSKPTSAKTTDAKGQAVTASLYQVKQKTSNGTLQFRSALVVTGKHVVYLTQPQEGKFTFSDDAWQAVALRAGQRASQLG